MIKLSILTGLMLAATPAISQPLWQNIEGGMTVVQVRTLYPDAKQRGDRTEIKGYLPLPDCPSNVHIMHPAGSVSEVRVRGKGSIGGICSAKIMEALVAKYGAPLTRDITNAETYLENRTLVWSKDGLLVRFQKMDDSGLVSASWEMTYSIISQEVGL